MDKIIIEGLECRAHVGVPAWERKKLQKILIDIELYLDLRKAGRSDNVRDTVDYAAVCRDVRSLCRSRHFKLVEALAEAMASTIIEKHSLVKYLRLRIKKFSVSRVCGVGVRISRNR